MTAISQLVEMFFFYLSNFAYIFFCFYIRKSTGVTCCLKEVSLYLFLLFKTESHQFAQAGPELGGWQTCSTTPTQNLFSFPFFFLMCLLKIIGSLFILFIRWSWRYNSLARVLPLLFKSPRFGFQYYIDQMWQHTSIILHHLGGKERQKEKRLKVILGYILSWRLDWTT